MLEESPSGLSSSFLDLEQRNDSVNLLEKYRELEDKNKELEGKMKNYSHLVFTVVLRLQVKLQRENELLALLQEHEIISKKKHKENEELRTKVRQLQRVCNHFP